MPFIKVCPAKEISVEKPKKYTIEDTDILLAKSNTNDIFAFNATCTHADKSLEKGKWNPTTAEITCPFHKAVFAVAENGAVKAPPAFVSLPVYQVEIRQESGQEFIYVNLD